MLPVLLLAALCAPTVEDKPVRVQSAHYEVTWAGTRAEADEAAAVLEAAWNELAIVLGAKPPAKERWKVRVFADEDARKRGAWDDGVTVPAQSVYASFSEVTRTAYVARLEGPAATRTALLYAACLQYHSLCKSKNLDITRTWYAAGLALAFSRSSWDGRRLRAFEAPRVEPTDLPAKALALLPNEEDALPPLVETDLLQPPLAWAAAAMCLDGGNERYRKAFLQRALGESGTKLSGEDFLRALGEPRAVHADLARYVRASQTPFEAFGDWEDRGDAGIAGAAAPARNAFCVLREGNERLSAVMSALPKGNGIAGFVVGWAGPEDCAVLSIEAPEIDLSIVRLGRTLSAQRYPLPGDACKERRIELVRDGAQHVLTVDGLRIGPIELPSGRMGFFVSGASVVFREPRWR